jgi:hypothetical protein
VVGGWLGFAGLVVGGMGVGGWIGEGGWGLLNWW